MSEFYGAVNSRLPNFIAKRKGFYAAVAVEEGGIQVWDFGNSI